MNRFSSRINKFNSKINEFNSKMNKSDKQPLNKQELYTLNQLLKRFSNNPNQSPKITTLCQNIHFNPQRKTHKSYTIDEKGRVPVNSKKQNCTNRCYICKCKYDCAHTFYKQMCNMCGQINYLKRIKTRRLDNKIAIVTGGRIKIGFYTALKLLEANCKVIITTRFAQDALKRYKAESNYEKWKHNLSIYQLDFLRINCVMQFVGDMKKTFPKIDYLINNAAQTIKRPPKFYAHLKNLSIEDHDDNIKLEYTNFFDQKLLDVNNQQTLDSSIIEANTENKQITRIDRMDQFFPPNQYDEHGQQIDKRPINSWILKLDEVSPIECAEVHLINSIVPCIMAGQFRENMKATMSNPSYIINVSSMEGSFSRARKPTNHPHTNMAKAALNMMTRTCGLDYQQDNIIMVSVDTGWNTIEEPNSYNIQSPIDCIDGAARILDPIFDNKKTFGVFYKDYKITTW